MAPSERCGEDLDLPLPGAFGHRDVARAISIEVTNGHVEATAVPRPKRLDRVLGILDKCHLPDSIDLLVVDNHLPNPTEAGHHDDLRLAVTVEIPHRRLHPPLERRLEDHRRSDRCSSRRIHKPEKRCARPAGVVGHCDRRWHIFERHGGGVIGRGRVASPRDARRGDQLPGLVCRDLGGDAEGDARPGWERERAGGPTGASDRADTPAQIGRRPDSPGDLAPQGGREDGVLSGLGADVRDGQFVFRLGAGGIPGMGVVDRHREIGGKHHPLLEHLGAVHPHAEGLPVARTLAEAPARQPGPFPGGEAPEGEPTEGEGKEGDHRRASGVWNVLRRELPPGSVAVNVSARIRHDFHRIAPIAIPSRPLAWP